MPNDADAKGGAPKTGKADQVTDFFVAPDDNEQKALEKQLKALNAQLETNPKDYNVLFSRANKLEKLNKPAEALKDYTTIIDSKDAELLPLALNNRAQILREQGKKQDALADFKAALANGPKMTGIMLGLASLSAELGNNDEALELYERAWNTDRNDLQISLALGQFQGSRGKFAEALNTFDQALLECAPNTDIYRLLQSVRGRALHELGRYADALECYKLGLTDCPEQSPIYSMLMYDRGLALLKLEKKPEALECFRIAFQADPQHIAAKENFDILSRELNPQSPAPKQQ